MINYAQSKLLLLYLENLYLKQIMSVVCKILSKGISDIFKKVYKEKLEKSRRIELKLN